MGVHKNITHNTFPRSGAWLHRAVNVCFHYDTAYTIPGIIVRDDNTEPGVLIIRLDDGRFVLGTECQWSLKR